MDRFQSINSLKGLSFIRKNFIKPIIAAVSVVAVINSASAGTQVRFQRGAIDTQTFTDVKLLSVDKSTNDYIVQFKRNITDADRKALGTTFKIFGYLPDDALVVRGEFKKLQAFAQSHKGVQGVIPYQAEFKLSLDIAPISVFDQYADQKVLIRTFTQADTDMIAKKIESLTNAIVEQADGRSIVAIVNRGQILKIANMMGVEHIQANPVIESFHFTMDDHLVQQTEAMAAGDYTDLQGDESGTRVMKFDAAWAAGYAGKGQIISMADTGLDSGNLNAIHGDFAGGVVSGYPFGLWSKSWEDPMGHGTHVAGSVMSRGTASKGLLKGGAYEGTMVAESMWSPMLKNLSVPSKLGDLFTQAYTDGARIHTNSWGSARTFGAYDNFAVQVDEWSSANPDMLILFAAGNSGVDKNRDGRIDENSMASPGTAKNILTVGASENTTKTGGIQVNIGKLAAAKDSWPADPISSDFISNNQNGMAMFSSRGPTNDGRIKPDIVAPGTNILSVRSQMKEASTLWGAYNQDYAWAGGTSMATPLTAGAVGVLRQVLIEKMKIASPSAALLKATMIHTAIDMFPGQFGEVGAAKGQEILTRRPNSDEGYGRVDVGNIMALGSATQFVDNRTGVRDGQEVSYNFELVKAGRLYANLVWTDAPGSPNAAQALVNDLDLVLTLPDGQKVSMSDRINNLEFIERDLPAGVYKLTVKGQKVPQGIQGAQSYALVYTAN